MNAPLPPIITSLYLSQLEILKTLRKDKKTVLLGGPFSLHPTFILKLHTKSVKLVNARTMSDKIPFT